MNITEFYIKKKSKALTGPNVTINPYPWIVEKNPKRGIVTERVLQKKNPERSIEKICMFLCFGFTVRKTRSVTVPKTAYIFVQHGIFSLRLAYAIWN